jgi:hypothetical protein
LVLFGKFTNARLAPGGNFGGGTSDLVIEKVLKPHKVLGDKKIVTLPRYVPKTRSKFLLFCHIDKGKIDPYRGVEVQKGDEIVKYLKGALALKKKSMGTRLRYCFNYLDNPELEIALDAYYEFAAADYKDYRVMARKLPADKIAGWLTDRKTPAYCYALYASLLGHCGKDEHAKLLRHLLDTARKRSGSSGMDGMLVAYTMLKPKEGWAHIRDDILSKPKEDFQVRYAGLRAVRFFWDYRPDLVARKERVKGMCLLLDQVDLADFAIEDLRARKCWDVADKVLALAKKESHNVRMIHRALLRYALSCPKKQAKAAGFVRAERKKDKQFVADMEEMLKMETETPSK